MNLTYTCTSPQASEQSGVPFVRILEGGRSFRSCRDFESSKTNSSDYQGKRHFYYSPNSSIENSFIEDIRSVSSDRYLRMPIVVTIMPFSNGVALPGASQSLTVNLDSGEASNESRNITLTYSPSGDGHYAHLFYEQGSPLTIRWTDTIPEDACVNLYLFQTARILLKINGGPGCLPASSGSYTWTVPDGYGASGLRIMASTPDGTSRAWGPLFSIVRPDPSTVQ